MKSVQIKLGECFNHRRARKGSASQGPGARRSRAPGAQSSRLLLPALLGELISLEVPAVGPSILHVVIQITAILVSITGIVPKVLDVGPAVLLVPGEVRAIRGEIASIFLDVGSLGLGRVHITRLHVLPQLATIL